MIWEVQFFVGGESELLQVCLKQFRNVYGTTA